MKKIILTTVSFYQNIIAVALVSLGLKGNCRFSVTCSEYAKNAILQKGVIKGSYFSFIRILKCQPFYKAKTYD